MEKSRGVYNITKVCGGISYTDPVYLLSQKSVQKSDMRFAVEQASSRSVLKAELFLN